MPEPLHTVNARLQFNAAHQSGLYSMTELAARYRISRQTGYEWVQRYAHEGADGLKPRSHAPHHCPHRISESMAEVLLDARRQHPTWGARKLIPWLLAKPPELEGQLPAASKVADLLQRRGWWSRGADAAAWSIRQPGRCRRARPTRCGRPTTRGSSARAKRKQS